MATKLGDITLTKQTGTTLTLSTDGKYVNDDVSFDIGVQSGAGSVTVASTDADIESDSSGRNISGVIGTKSSTAPTAGYYLKVSASGTGSSTITTAGWLDTGTLGTATASGTLYFPVDTATAAISGTNTVTPEASLSGSNISFSSTDNGISVTSTGAGGASIAITATGNQAGYVESGATLGTQTVTGYGSTTYSKYISGVTLVAPASGSRTFSITVPNGEGTPLTFVFNVNSSGDVTITES